MHRSSSIPIASNIRSYWLNASLQRSYAIMSRAKQQAGVPLELIKHKKGTKIPTHNPNGPRYQTVPKGILKKNDDTWKTAGLASESTFDDYEKKPKKINSFDDIEFVNNRNRSFNNRSDNDQRGFQRDRQESHENNNQWSRDDYANSRESRYNGRQDDREDRYSSRQPYRDDGYKRFISERQSRYQTSRKQDKYEIVHREVPLMANKDFDTLTEERIKNDVISAEKIKRERRAQEQNDFTPVLRSMKTREPAGLSQRLIKIVQNVKQPENPHTLKVAVIGEANAGKSTLINKIVEEDVTVVSPKAHTTRERILAVLSQDNYQVVFLDTPGIVPDNSGTKMNRTLLTSAWRSLDEADHVVILVDSRKALMPEARLAEDSIIDHLKKYSIPATLVFNKMDLLNSDDTILEEVRARYKNGYEHIKQTLYVSALHESGLNRLKDSLFSASQPKEWAYPKELKSEMSDLKRVEELIRVEFFKRLHQYIPYMLKQENVGWTETERGIRIDQTVYVERDSQQKIVVGANGAVIDQVVQEARIQISKALKRPVQLYIQVRTKKH
ncbi:P-loop containing nucleoside triphosphate hydrolase protein [Phycomyces nitens]|nr:P-loop containing nucleoside triphosphate hydrolase protein [Phycomyces nitens]